MMGYIKKSTLYVETSVFGFYYDEKPENRDKKEKTKLLFQQIQNGYFTALYSDIVLAEIEKLTDDFKKHRLLELISRFGLRKIDMPSAEDELRLLSTIFLEKQIIPLNKKDDALHLALVILSPQIDYFVTWNCKHLANVNVFRRVKAAVLPLGYELKFEIVTPEEVIFYE
uniref:PIN domain-containing protein n=1 Tax=candidate division WOR-3 bacterium TaxID=2052148 RepID=A0A7V1EI47_UNCW3